MQILGRKKEGVILLFADASAVNCFEQALKGGV